MAAVACAGAALLAWAAGPVAAQAHPRFDVRVPMRDGVELSADVWLPEGDGPWPVVLIRTPYLKTMELADFPGWARALGEAGYALVVQDVRGRGDSDGEFDFFFADAEDGHDTVEWAARQPWSNGDVCMMGVSYLGTVQWLAAKEHPEGLRCLVSTAPAGRYGFEELPYQGGAFMLQWALSWINGTSGVVQQTGQGVDWDRARAHRPLLTADSVMGREMPLYRDFLRHAVQGPYYERIVLDEDDFRTLDLPVLHVTGLFDGDQPGAIHYWHGMRDHSPAADRQWLLLGPWNHAQTFVGGEEEIGDLELGPASIVDLRKLHVDFFDRFLKGEADAFTAPPAKVWFTGANEWREFEAWPPPGVRTARLHLRSGGRANSFFGDGELTWEAPGADEPPDSYTYDPKRPVPSPAGDVVDRRPLERRDDVLVYTSEELDAPVTVAGRLYVELHAASDARDTDWVAALVDVFPDGLAIPLGPRGLGVIRARYRNGFDREVPLEPGSVERYRIELYDVAHVFEPGHRIRLEVTSSAAPLFNPNQNTGDPVATDTAWAVARQTVHHDAERPSAVLLPLLEGPEGSGAP